MIEMPPPSIEDIEAALRAAHRNAQAKYRATAEVLHRRFVLDPPDALRVIASDLGVSQARIYQREGEGLFRLRRSKSRGDVLKVAPHGTVFHQALFGCREEESCIAQPQQPMPEGY